MLLYKILTHRLLSNLNQNEQEWRKWNPFSV
jgi:hypothetical protein